MAPKEETQFILKEDLSSDPLAQGLECNKRKTEFGSCSSPPVNTS